MYTYIHYVYIQTEHPPTPGLLRQPAARSGGRGPGPRGEAFSHPQMPCRV